jgi:hypothetical protein
VGDGDAETLTVGVDVPVVLDDEVAGLVAGIGGALTVADDVDVGEALRSIDAAAVRVAVRDTTITATGSIEIVADGVDAAVNVCVYELRAELLTRLLIVWVREAAGVSVDLALTLGDSVI